MSAGKAKRIRNRGFSLIELTIVLILVGLALVLVAPSFSKFSQRVELKSTAQKISALLRYFRSESVQKGIVYQVLLDTELREVRVVSVEEGEEAESEVDNLKEKAFKKSYSLPEGIRIKEFKIPSPQFSADFPAIEFYPSGGSNGGSFLLDMEGAKGYRIKVHFLTGVVEVEES